jgi:hypothetical protein
MTKNKEFLDNLEKHNAKLRIKFEKEAHDREQESIKSTVDGYNDWIKERASTINCYGTR